jgi:phosphatidylglycerol---prolipoprotein diacylglyceryl transferase
MPFLVLPFPIIDPIAVDIGPFPIRWYALAYIAGFIFGWLGQRLLVARDQLWREGQPRPEADTLDDLVAFVALGAVIGGRLGHVLIYDPGFYLLHPLEIVQTWKGGMAFHGGLLGAVLGIVLFARKSGAPVLTVADLCAGVAPIGLFFGRIANFIKPEMWGRETDVPWAMVFPQAGDAPRHPSQLYEAGLEGLALLFVLLVAIRFGALKRPGLVTGLFGIGYGAARIFCEFFREPDPVQEALQNGFTMGMALSLPMIVIGAALALYALRGKEARI